MNGFLCVRKPAGMTSSAVVLRLRKRLPKGTKIGHAGTLDPDAAGVLPVMIGKATRLFDLITDKEKVYEAQWVPGIETDTQDLSGQILREEKVQIGREELEAVIPRFIGEIDQVPPLYSALKRNGKRLYELAREGCQVEVAARKIHVDGIEILGRAECGSWMLRIRCGRGTYIRTLCKDIGGALGIPACMGTLVRTASGPFTIESALSPEELESLSDWEPVLLPMDYPLAHLPRITISEQAEKQVRCGNRIPEERIEGPYKPGVCSRLYLGDRFCGIGALSDGEIHFDAMLLE